ncbi:MazG-like nucleotide pyrophosphohydrolase [Stenotrophomonas phage Piffle]|uniref:MazG-like nucleotide pyrophosphohydrolase n=1 Tax=Stenotrophomonas phage Piffle TaxID=2859656 RepID=A0AAE7WLY5_9CAUD|nr:nucleotide pyrophosphohydrolase [Stenotrophomonas phage Piffle]QYW01908.1 MazG-like nucleotide pyrophosphohydrolase [Stenotrophomonas phage Piffle]
MHDDNSNTLKRTLEWFKEAKPTPSRSDLMVQLGVHFEEVCELLDVVFGASQSASLNVLCAKENLHRLAEDMKANPLAYEISHEDRQEALDALCDQNVTGAGTAYMLGMDFEGAMQEVNRSNFSKFVNGKAIFTEQGKIAKGPAYFKPDLSPYI